MTVPRTARATDRDTAPVTHGVSAKWLRILRRALVVLGFNAVLFVVAVMSGATAQRHPWAAGSACAGVLIINALALAAAPRMFAIGTSHRRPSWGRPFVIGLAVAGGAILALYPPTSSLLKNALMTPVIAAALTDDAVAIAAAFVLIIAGFAIAATEPAGPPSSDVVGFVSNIYGVASIVLVPALLALATLREAPDVVQRWRSEPGSVSGPRPLAGDPDGERLRALIGAGYGDEELRQLHAWSDDQIERERTAAARLSGVGHLIRMGRSYNAIADELGLTRHQVEYLVLKLRARYGVNDKRELRQVLLEQEAGI